MKTLIMPTIFLVCSFVCMYFYLSGKRLDDLVFALFFLYCIDNSFLMNRINSIEEKLNVKKD